MKWIKIVFDFYINASIHVALSVCAFFMITAFYFNISVDNNLVFFMFFATITGYNFVKYAGLVKFHHKRLRLNLKVIQVFSFCSFSSLLYFLFQIDFFLVFLCIPLGILTLLYAIPLGKKQINLRSVWLLKIIIVALIWAIATVLFPVFNVVDLFSKKVILMFLQRFIFIVVLILPFDIRDINNDSDSLQTIPKKIGVKKTKLLGAFLLFICLLIELFLYQIETINVFSFILITTLLLLWKSSMNQQKYYSSFWVEAVPIFWLILVLFIQ